MDGLTCCVQRCDSPNEGVLALFWRGNPEAAYIKVCWFHRDNFPEWKLHVT